MTFPHADETLQERLAAERDERLRTFDEMMKGGNLSARAEGFRFPSPLAVPRFRAEEHGGVQLSTRRLFTERLPSSLKVPFFGQLMGERSQFARGFAQEAESGLRGLSEVLLPGQQRISAPPPTSVAGGLGQAVGGFATFGMGGPAPTGEFDWLMALGTVPPVGPARAALPAGAKAVSPFAKQLREFVAILDAMPEEERIARAVAMGHKADPDMAYRAALSTGTKMPLKKGETWRGRVLKIADRADEREAKFIDAIGPPMPEFPSVPSTVEMPTRGGTALFVQPMANAANIYGIRPIQASLSKGEVVRNQARQTLRFATRGRVSLVDDNPYAQGAIAEKVHALPRIQNVAQVTGAQADAQVRGVFQIDRQGQIPSLAVVDSTLPGPPTLADIAARYPTFEPSLSAQQRNVMEGLRRIMAQFKAVLVETDVPDPGIRPDVMEGGFYLPRGKALAEGADNPVRIRAGGRGIGGKKGFEKAVRFTDSQAQGIREGYEYAPFQEAIQSYVEDAGKRALDKHIANFFVNATDPITGIRLGQTSADRVPVGLRAVHTSLYNRIHSRRMTLVRQQVRGKVAQRELERAADVTIGAAQRRTGTQARLAQMQVNPQDLVDIRKEVQDVISDGRSFAYDLGRNVEQLRQAQGAENAITRQAQRMFDELQAALDETGRIVAEWSPAMTELQATLRQKGPEQVKAAAELVEGGEEIEIAGDLLHAVLPFQPEIYYPEAYHQLNRAADNLERQLLKMAPRAEAMAKRVDELTEKGTLLKDLSQLARSEHVAARRTERALVDQQRSFAVLRRQLRLLEQEERRTARGAIAAGGRVTRAGQREFQTSQAYDQLRDAMRDMEADWQRALSISRDIPRGRNIIDLPGLQQYDFPEEIANATNKVLRDLGPLNIKGSRAIRVTVESANALATLYRGFRATFDNSVLGIQGLLGLYGNTPAYATAMRVNIHAWTDEKVLGRYLVEFDNVRAQEGRLTSLDWGRFGLHIGGIETEFALGQGFARRLGKLPVIRNANRAFGYFGDALRLEWADTMLVDELDKGRTLEGIAQSGDIERIARIAGNMTGWSENRAFGSVGDLLLFAPRFLQSRFETVTHAAMGTRPGAKLDERAASKAMLKMIGLGAMMTFFINEMLGEDTDPLPIRNGRANPNFMRIRWGGRDWSLFGPWNGLLMNMMQLASGRPVDPLRSLGSGIISNAWDLIAIANGAKDPFARAEGVEGLLDRIPGLDKEDKATQFVARILENTLAFSIENQGAAVGAAIQQADESVPGAIASGAAATVGTFVGGTSSPLTEAEQARIARDDAAQRMFNSTYNGLEIDQKAKVNKDPTVSEALAKRDSRSREFGSAYQIYKDEAQIIKERQNALINEAAQRVTGKQLREAIALHQRDKARDLESLRERSQDALAFLEQVEPANKDFDKAYNAYTNAIFADDLEDEATGEFNFALRDERLAQLRRDFGPTLIDRVETFLRDDDVPIVKELRADREFLKPYWDIGEERAAEFRMESKYAAYQAANDEGKIRMRQDDPMIGVLLSYISRVKIIFRQTQDPQYERILRKWGYISSWEHPENILADMDRRRAAEVGAR